MSSEPFRRLRQFFSELKRRNVYKVAVTYAVVTFVGFQAAKLLIPSTVLPAWTDEFFLFLLIVGFPVAVVVAWAFELTPDGMRRTGHAGARERNVPTALVVVGALALVAVSLAAGWYLTGDAGSDDAGRSVAVLPFSSVGGEEGAQLAVGVHDDLLTRLSTVSDLRVISRTSVERYDETEMTVPQIARELDVTWVVEGGVQQAGGAIRVNAQLIDGRRDDHRWAETYEREMTAEGLFSIQEDLTRRIARSLQATLSSGEEKRVARRPTEDLEAYRLYLRGRAQLDRRTEEGMRRALELFQRAIEQDSTYALAWSGLADAHNLLAAYGGRPADSLHPQALQAAQRALDIDPELAEAHASLGLIQQDFERDGPTALRELQRATELQPSYARAHQWLGIVLEVLGRQEEALRHYARAVELDPMSPPIRLSLVISNYHAGRTKEALAEARRSEDLAPTITLAHLYTGIVLSSMGRHEEAVDALRRVFGRTDPDPFASATARAWLAVTHHRAGDAGLARELLAELEQAGEVPFASGVIRAELRQRDAALRALEKADYDPLRTSALRYDPVFDPLRDDPRYRDLIRRINQQWGLNPDGSLPDSVDVSFGSKAETDG